MIGAVMFVLLIGLMFIGIPIAFSMGLSFLCCLYKVTILGNFLVSEKKRLRSS